MGRFIALPLYDHTTTAEIAECLDALRSIGLDDAIAIDTARDWTELDAELREEGVRRPERRSIELAAELDGLRDRALRVAEVVKPDVDGYSGFDRGGADRPLSMAAIDQEGRRTDAPPPAPGVYTVEQARELREVRLQAERLDVERYAINPDGFSDGARFSRALEILTIASSPIPGRDGWRRTGDGREWYSDAWLGQTA